MVKNMDKELTPSLVVQNMKVNSGMVNMMDKEHIPFLVVQNM